MPGSPGNPLSRILPGREAYLAGIAAQIVRAGRPVLARVWGALVHLLFTVAARVARLAMTEVGVASVHAEAGVSAQAGHVQSCKREAIRHVWQAGTRQGGRDNRNKTIQPQCPGPNSDKAFLVPCTFVVSGPGNPTLFGPSPPTLRQEGSHQAALKASCPEFRTEDLGRRRLLDGSSSVLQRGGQETEQEGGGPTLASRSHLARDVGYVAVQAGPAARALAAVVITDLPALPSILTGRRVAPVDQALREKGGRGRCTG